MAIAAPPPAAPSRAALQLPLMATPLPNITVYYTGYRIYSHYRALQAGVGGDWAWLGGDWDRCRYSGHA